MDKRKRLLLMITGSIALFAFVGVWFFKERVFFYWNFKDESPVVVARTFDASTDLQAAKPNVDLGFLALRLDLSAQANFTVDERTIKIEDQGHTIRITMPEDFSSWDKDATPNDIAWMDEVIALEGNYARAERDMYALSVTPAVIFSSPSEFRRCVLLSMIRLMQLPGVQELDFFVGPEHEALLKTYPSHVSLTWSTKKGNRRDQCRGEISFFAKGKDKDYAWVTDIARSLVIHEKGKTISDKEMIERLQKIRNAK